MPRADPARDDDAEVFMSIRNRETAGVRLLALTTLGLVACGGGGGGGGARGAVNGAGLDESAAGTAKARLPSSPHGEQHLIDGAS